MRLLHQRAREISRHAATSGLCVPVGSHMGLSEPSSFNPYLPPQSGGDDRPSPERGRLRRSYLAWIFGGLNGIVIFALALTHVVEYSESTAILWELVKKVDGIFALVKLAIVGVWIHTAWSDVPLGTREELHVSPGKAVGFLFIPFVNFYWILAMPRRLCIALDRALISRGGKASAPIVIALLAPALHLLHGLLSKTTEGLPVLVSFAVTGGLWFAFMLRCDRARAELLGVVERR